MWVKIDDGLFSNPKVIKASPLARSLYVAGLCHCATGLTDGAIDKAAVPLLLAQTGAPRTAVANLVSVGLWLKNGENFEVKDYLAYNPSGDHIRQEREAAKERKQRQRSKGRSAVDQGTDGRFTEKSRRDTARDDHRDTPRDGRRESHRESQGVSPATRPVPSRPSTSSNNSDGVAAAVAGAGAPTEEDPPPNPETTAEAAIAHMAACDLARARAEGKPIRSEAPYLAKLTDSRRTENLAKLTELARQSPTADPIDLAERIDPTCGPLDGGTARADAAWHAAKARLDAEAQTAKAIRAQRTAALELLGRSPDLEAELTAKARAEHPDAKPVVIRQHVIHLAITHLEDPAA